jgi:hypothetical protein
MEQSHSVMPDGEEISKISAPQTNHGSWVIPVLGIVRTPFEFFLATPVLL